MKRAVLVLGLVLLPLGAGAVEVEPISPDRAGFVTGTGTVGAGAVQLEGGVAYGRERIAASPTQRRFGVEVAVRGASPSDWKSASPASRWWCSVAGTTSPTTATSA